MRSVCIVLSIVLMYVLPAGSQTRVERKSALSKGTFGVTYSLPRTSVVLHAEVSRVTCKPGLFGRYAGKYLGIEGVVSVDEVYYELANVTVSVRGVPDPEQVYLVEFRSGTVAPYVYLTEDGLLCSINDEYVVPGAAEEPKAAEAVSAVSSSAVFTEELLQAGSIAKQAEVAAKQIYHIRESKLNILTGDADNVPPDGEAMKLVISQLEFQERALTELFTGTVHRESEYHDIAFFPYQELDGEIIFRFSRQLGIVDHDDLGGSPVYVKLSAINPLPVETPDGRRKRKSNPGLVYNIPGRARIVVSTADRVLYQGELLVTQFGSTDVLSPAIFEDRKKPVRIHFYPELGSIKQIIQ